MDLINVLNVYSLPRVRMVHTCPDKFLFEQTKEYNSIYKYTVRQKRRERKKYIQIYALNPAK